MKHPLGGLDDAIAALRRAWPAEGSAAVSEIGRDALVAVNDALGEVGRRLDAVRAEVAAEIDHESRPELGADSLAKQQGFRNPAALISATTGVGTGDAKRLVSVGKAIAPRQNLIGEQLPARHPHVAEAMKSARLGLAAANIIIARLDRIAVRTTFDARDEAERILVEKAPGLSADQVRKLVTQAEAWLDQDGVEPKERDRRSEQYARMWVRDGFLCIDAKFEVTAGAPIKTAVEATVSASFRAAKDVFEGDEPDQRSLQQRQADALIQLAEHALGCEHNDLPLGGASVVVRMDLETLQEGVGLAEIDGIDQPVSPETARHYAAAAKIIPVVLDGKGEILHWGREKRYFTRAQKLALVERDGGCAMCNLPPGMTKAHHLNWWSRDHGETNLEEGVLFCEPCHHHIHDNGWEIRIEGKGTRAKVWFIPPATVDPARTPRLGGRARFDYALTA
ncbi:DUF222 domain-containing protein [Microbacterium horticulturae]|uniref:DUF222 domain-containing protein n=1 Tax=Microbacterium horticulturae TaxID=3028316 RepID=A0ABY8BVG6_9MICO|nr:DUF222 domain-containing protein [Microbacterium sp. KACC 23027]WEG08170.1 DUF222 domain-containing protein [Microbacterium sp. KACC 23027]